MKASNVNVSKGEIYLERVKGSETYGKPRLAPIHPEGLPILIRYMELRNVFLTGRNADSEFMFFSTSHLRNLSANTLRKHRVQIIEETGVQYDFRMCRRSFGQFCIDGGLPMSSLSVIMGHSTTVTTERYYARVRQETAVSQASAMWKEQKGVKK